MRKHKVDDHLQMKLSGGRIVEATIKAVVETTEGVRLQVSFGEETAGADLSVADRHRGSVIVSAAQSLKNGAFDGGREFTQVTMALALFRN